MKYQGFEITRTDSFSDPEILLTLEPAVLYKFNNHTTLIIIQ
jgi:hypothetical protein